MKYTSAHVDYVESEFIVHSFQSCQDKPETIEEVRRSETQTRPVMNNSLSGEISARAVFLVDSGADMAAHPRVGKRRNHAAETCDR